MTTQSIFLPGESHGQKSLAIHRVTKSQTWLKWLSTHAHIFIIIDWWKSPLGIDFLFFWTYQVLKLKKKNKPSGDLYQSVMIKMKKSHIFTHKKCPIFYQQHLSIAPWVMIVLGLLLRDRRDQACGHGCIHFVTRLGLHSLGWGWWALWFHVQPEPLTVSGTLWFW